MCFQVPDGSLFVSRPFEVESQIHKQCIMYVLPPGSPMEEKFRSIRRGNAVFQRRVSAVPGGADLLVR